MKRPELYRSFIAVFPQTESSWFGEPAEQAIKALDQTVAEFNGDAQRIYLMGASLGGYGSWFLAANIRTGGSGERRRRDAEHSAACRTENH
jgi:hypothetical protein